MRTLWLPLILFLPGCTFFSFSNNGPGPRPAAELKDISPAVYIVLGVFCLILVAAVLAILFKESKQHDLPFGKGDEKGLAFMLALFAGLVVLLLVG